MARSNLALVVFLLLFVEKGLSCDACGCSVGGAGIGLMAAYRQNFVGIGYQYTSFSSRLEHAKGATDMFHNLELSMRLRIGQRLNLQINHPYRFAVRSHPNGDGELDGMGDTRMVGNFILFNQVALGKKMKLYAEAGAGVKTPLGKYDPDLHHTANLPENFNPGNGSWAGLLQTNLVLSKGNSGMVLNGSYQHNRDAKGGYRFGHQWLGQAQVFHQIPLTGSLTLTPYGGAVREEVGRDTAPGGVFAKSTGGSGWFAVAGFNLKFDNWLCGANFSHPFSQRYASAEVKAGVRWALQLSHIF